ncbi:class I SAM-dependent methyltransferase [Cyanobacteria bacterium FACHB-471]|nr:class I SAM-dependent methyltransferase [Cyanobacteria bacterium FACHB-471]
MAFYDVIGKTYAQTRRSDPRITKKLLEILASSPASTIADIGAGTGSYASVLAEHGYRVFAIEPSETMRSQAIAHPAIEWMDAYVENLPLSDQSVDAAIIMLAFHHFPDYRQALNEMHRVVGNGQMIFFTYDPEMISSFWLTEYFPSFIRDVESTFLPIPKLLEEIQSITDSVANVIPFPLPNDLSDSFAAVGWARPELYLDSDIRNGISSFSKIDDDELNSGLFRLSEDLERGWWDCKYGHLRQQSEYDVGYRFFHRSAV